MTPNVTVAEVEIELMYILFQPGDKLPGFVINMICTRTFLPTPISQQTPLLMPNVLTIV
jgi:hypothetical protein